MTIKKLLLIAITAMAAIAFAAPAAQADPTWNIEGEQEFEAAGSLTSIAGGGAFTTGPAEVHFNGVAFNEENGMGGGVISEAEITAPPGGIPTNLSSFGCNATSATAENLPWEVTLVTEEVEGKKVPAAEISTVTFTNHYNEACKAFGIPSTVSAAGTAVGTLTSEIFGTCIDFNNSGNLKNEANGQPVNLSGEVCIPGLYYH